MEAPEQARAELRQPVQCCFVGLVGVATILIAGAALPHARVLGLVLLAMGGVCTVAFGVWRTGGLWQGGFVGWLVIRTLARLFQGQLIARPAPVTP